MQHKVLSGTRRLFRAAVASELPRTPIWLITRGAQRVSSADAVSPVQSCLWGFGRAASLEHPQLWGGLADLASDDAGEWSRLIDHVVAAPPGEDQVALREQAVYVPRLTRRAGQPTAIPLVLRSDATYLVSGGLGAIGLEIAEYLAAHGARHLALTGRRSPSDAAQQRIDAIREQWACEFRVIAADVANPDDVARVLTTVRTELPPLAGIVHAAGEVGTTPLRSLDDAEVDRVFAGKVWGAWYLSEATADVELDFFLSTSSISAVWGSAGQTAYSAANAFLDGLAWRQRARGISGTSVNFGPWSAGMADEDARARLDQRGVRTLSPADALAGMAELMVDRRNERNVVARIDWARFLPLYQQAGKRSFLAELEREVPDSAPAPRPPSGTTPLVERLTVAPVQQRKKLLADYLRDAVAEVTRIDAARDPRVTRVLRPRHGFADGRRIAAPHRAGVGKELPASRWRWTTPACPTWRTTCSATCSALNEQAPVQRLRWHPRSRRARMNRSRSSRWPAASPARPIPRHSGRCCPVVSTRSGRSRRTASTSTSSTTRIQTPGQDLHALRRIPRRDRRIRSGVLRHLAARGRLDRAAAAADAGTVWEGLERAGYAPASLRGSRTGIFVGVAANEYSHLLSADSVEKIEAHFITGNALNAIAGRVAFALGLEGPAMAVDTACSSSLVAVHQACQALHSGDCDLALAGGVNVLLSPVIDRSPPRAPGCSPRRPMQDLRRRRRRLRAQ